MFKSLQWEDWMGVALGTWMMASPWTLGYVDNAPAAMNALVVGAILVLEEMLDVGVHESAEEWIDIAAGAWLCLSPYALGFASSPVPAANAIAVGLLSLLFALWALSPLDARVALWWHGHGLKR
jgi:hypothetical protein